MQYNANQKLRRITNKSAEVPFIWRQAIRENLKRESIDKHSKQINNQELYLN